MQLLKQLRINLKENPYPSILKLELLSFDSSQQAELEVMARSKLKPLEVKLIVKQDFMPALIEQAFLLLVLQLFKS
jgi:hypothetical protein